MQYPKARNVRFVRRSNLYSRPGSFADVEESRPPRIGWQRIGCGLDYATTSGLKPLFRREICHDVLPATLGNRVNRIGRVDAVDLVEKLSVEYARRDVPMGAARHHFVIRSG